MGYTAKPRGNVVFVANRNNQSDNNIENNNTSHSWISLSIYNTGINDINLIINSLSIIISANETFDEDFEDFNSVLITPSINGQQISYRLLLRS